MTGDSLKQELPIKSKQTHGLQLDYTASEVKADSPTSRGYVLSAFFFYSVCAALKTYRNLFNK